YVGQAELAGGQCFSDTLPEASTLLQCPLPQFIRKDPLSPLRELIPPESPPSNEARGDKVCGRETSGSQLLESKGQGTDIGIVERDCHPRSTERNLSR